MAEEDFHCYEFGEFRLDGRRRSLSRAGERVPVSARNFDLLLYMVENDGRIIEHDELLDKVWAGTFVEQATLKKGISALRQLLTETPETEFIRTIPRRGYSFVWPVRKVPENSELLFVRKTEREVVVEEFEETDESVAPEQHPGTRVVGAYPALLAEARTGSAAKTRWPWRLALIGLGLATIVLGGLGLRYFFSRKPSPHFNAENVRITRITNHGRAIVGSAVSPDGNYVLYLTGDDDREVLWLRQVAANSERKLTTPAKGFFWAIGFAPDNSFVYYIFKSADVNTKSGLFKVPLLGGEPLRLQEDVSSLAAAPDGKQLAVVRIADNITTLFTVDLNGENQRTVATFPANYRLWNIVWTPDGASILCTLRKTEGEKMLFYVSEFSLANGQENTVLPAQERIIYSAIWLPDKSGLMLEVREPNADIRQIWHYAPATTTWRRVTNDNNSYPHFSLTRDGSTIVALRQSRLASLSIAEATTPTIKRDDFHPVNDAIGKFDGVDWFADGRLMYTAVEDQQENVFTVNRDGTNARAITNGDNGMWLYATVAGNGQNVCLISTRSGIRQVWRIDGDGKNLTPMTAAKSPVVTARILKDNETAIYFADQDGKINLLWRTHAGKTEPVTDTDTGIWALSPDESLLAASLRDNSSGLYHIELRPVGSGQVVRSFSFQPASHLIFTPDGKNLAYDVVVGGVGQIMIQPLDGRASYALTDFPADSLFSFAWSRDGKLLAVIRGKQIDDVVMIKAGGA